MLSERLRELQREGIVERRVIPDANRSVEYHLTPKGQALEAVVAELSHWAETWLPEDLDQGGPPATAPLKADGRPGPRRGAAGSSARGGAQRARKATRTNRAT
jgi:DNA-binding MarR family transcriptional regulator